MSAILSKEVGLNSSINSAKTLKAVVSSEESLKAVVSSEGTLRGTTSVQGSLTATMTSKGDLKASISKQKSMSGKARTFAISVDSELSYSSTNPVQNKVITEALDAKIPFVKIAKNTDIDKLFG